MKYAKYLARQTIPEWSERYIKYKKLKKELKHLVRVFNTRPTEFGECQQAYVELLYDELESINTFFEAKEKELQDQYVQLKTLLAESWQKEPPKHAFFSFPTLTKRKGQSIKEAIANHREDHIPETPLVPARSEATLHRVPPKIDTSFKSPDLPPRSPIRDAELPKAFVPASPRKISKGAMLTKRYRFAVKRALEEVHRGLNMLKEYAALNSVGFRKVIKKHDKVPKFPSLVHFLEEEVYKSHFHTSQVSTTLMAEVETVYANLFTQGNTRQAVDKLEVPNTEHQHDWVSFRFGICIGACAVLAIYLCGISPNTTKESPYADYVMYAFRLLGIPVFWLWTFATVMLIWNSVRINYVFIFGWDPRKHITPRHLYEISATLSFMWLAFYTGYYNSVHKNYPFAYLYAPVYPFVLLVLFSLFVVFPFNGLYRSSRWWMFQTIGRILRTPLLPVKFKDFFYTNQFTSLKYAFSDLGDMLYFYVIAIWNDETSENTHSWSKHALVYRPTLQAYPALLRLLQCLRRYKDSKDRRHLINTGKYTFSVLTVIASGIRKAFPDSLPILCIYCLIASASTIYSWLWDVMMDWDLGYRKHNFLRAKLMYSKPYAYYIAAVLDLLLRAVWAVTLGITTHTTNFSNSMSTIASVTEIVRRFTWNIFRLENEHLKNCYQSNATAIPSLITAYKQLHTSFPDTTLNTNTTKDETDHTNYTMDEYENTNNPPTNNNSNNNNNNNNMHDYESEEEEDDVGDEEEQVLDNFQLTPPSGIRLRHVSIGEQLHD